MRVCAKGHHRRVLAKRVCEKGHHRRVLTITVCLITNHRHVFLYYRRLLVTRVCTISLLHMRVIRDAPKRVCDVSKDSSVLCFFYIVKPARY